MCSRQLNALIIDGTVVYRKLLSDVLTGFPEVGNVYTAPNGKVALAKLETNPTHIVVLDDGIADMGGLEALKAIRQRLPDTAVIIVGGKSAEATVRALEMGALDFIAKPDPGTPEASRAFLRDRLRPLIRHVLTNVNLGTTAKTIEASPAPAAPSQELPAIARVYGPFEAVVIGISTGGPNALLELVPRLPADLGIPVLIVQHMPAGFTESLARHLDDRSAIRVKEARDGEPILPGCVYIAPGGKHMAVRHFTHPENRETMRVIGLNENPPENSCRPSADVLFRSAAANYEGRVLSLVMTGMGIDGLEGTKLLKQKGAMTLTQSEASCVVYGMPMAVDEAGLSDESVPLRLLAARITELVRSRQNH